MSATPGSSQPTLWRRLDLSSRWVDAVIAVVVLLMSLTNIAVQAEVDILEIPGGGLLLLALASAALLWRRSQSIVVLVIVLVIVVLWQLLDYPGNPVFHILTALYSVGRYVADRWMSLAALGASLVVAAIGQVTDGDPISDLITGLLVVGLSWYAGRRIRVRRELAEAERERAELLEWRRATEAQRAIADARAGIARELHDVVAHNVSVMTVQAGVARLVVEKDPAQAQEAIAAVEDAGRSTLEELRHLLGVLRPDEESDGLDPQPALNQIQTLIERLGRTGMSISLVLDVESELPVRVDLFAYRITQEALTNVLKHAGPDAEANVHIAEADGQLLIEVADTGAGAAGLPGSGRGIAGMQERASLLGGTFEAGPRPEGGFRVKARLPIGEQ